MTGKLLKPGAPKILEYWMRRRPEAREHFSRDAELYRLKAFSRLVGLGSSFRRERVGVVHDRIGSTRGFTPMGGRGGAIRKRGIILPTWS